MNERIGAGEIDSIAPRGAARQQPRQENACSDWEDYAHEQSLTGEPLRQLPVTMTCPSPRQIQATAKDPVRA